MASFLQIVVTVGFPFVIGIGVVTVSEECLANPKSIYDRLPSVIVWICLATILFCVSVAIAYDMGFFCILYSTYGVIVCPLSAIIELRRMYGKDFIGKAKTILFSKTL